MNQDLQNALDSMPGAKQTNVTEGMTSAGRLDKMLGSNSDLMKRASTQGKQVAQSRGLLNSSMAAGASQGAMIDRAQPFALQDSNNLIQNAQRNTDSQNQRGLLQAGLIGDSYKSNQNYEQQKGLNEQAYGYEGKLAEQQQGYQQDNMKLSDSIQQKQMELSQALEQGNMQLASKLESELAEQQAGLQASRDERLAGLDQDMARLGAELQESQAGNDFERTQALESQRAGIQRERDNLVFGQQEEAARNELSREMERMGYAFELDQKNVSQAFSSSLTQATLQNVQSIQADPNLDPEAKRNAVQNALDIANQSMAWGEKFYNTSMPSINPPGTPRATSPTTSSAGQQEATGYLNKYPDLQRYYEKNAASIHRTIGGSSAADYAKWHYENIGKNEGRQFS